MLSATDGPGSDRIIATTDGIPDELATTPPVYSHVEVTWSALVTIADDGPGELGEIDNYPDRPELTELRDTTDDNDTAVHDTPLGPGNEVDADAVGARSTDFGSTTLV